MKKSFRSILGLGLLGVMLATAVVPSIASPQKKGSKGGKKSGKGKSQKKGGGKK